jgi:hypothetical protein
MVTSALQDITIQFAVYVLSDGRLHRSIDRKIP